MTTVANDEYLQQAESNFKQLVSLLGLSAELQSKNERNTIYLHVKTNEPGRIIGRKGQTLNALQHLLNSILLNQKKVFPKVLIDVEGNNEEKKKPVPRPSKKTDTLQSQILDAAKEVKRWGEDVTLVKLTRHDLKQVASVIKDDRELEVFVDESSNKGQGKVKIRLKK